MIGFYNYTVILTYMSLASAIVGMTFSSSGHFYSAVICLALSGFFDMFDGKVARRKKDRSDNEKLFGIQLDSLCDVVAFGAAPSVLCYCFGVKGSLGMLVICFYCICGVIRLAYFNVLETNNFFSDNPPEEKIFHGLPITSISVILPLVFLLNFILPPPAFRLALIVMLLVVGVLFVADFQMKKPTNKQLALLVIIVGISLISVFVLNLWGVIKLPMFHNNLVVK